MTRIFPTSISLVAGAALAIASVSAALAADLTAVPSGKYEVDPTHAYIHFSYNHLGLSNPTLSFDNFTVDMELDNEDPTQSSINVSIDPASIVSGSSIWNDHLTSGNWFDVADYPVITFQSTAVEPAGDGAYKVTGELTIKNETKPVNLNVAINAAMNHPMSGEPVIGLDASAQVLRSDYGLGQFAPNVSDEVAIDISVEMIKTGD